VKIEVYFFLIVQQLVAVEKIQPCLFPDGSQHLGDRYMPSGNAHDGMKGGAFGLGSRISPQQDHTGKNNGTQRVFSHISSFNTATGKLPFRVNERKNYFSR
jgi:hypothetical protein